MKTRSMRTTAIIVTTGVALLFAQLGRTFGPCDKTAVQNAQCTGKGTVTYGSCQGQCADNTCRGVLTQVLYINCNQCKGVPADPENPKVCMAYNTPAQCSTNVCYYRTRSARCGCPAEGQGTCMVPESAWGDWSGDYAANNDCD